LVSAQISTRGQQEAPNHHVKVDLPDLTLLDTIIQALIASGHGNPTRQKRPRRRMTRTRTLAALQPMPSRCDRWIVRVAREAPALFRAVFLDKKEIRCPEQNATFTFLIILDGIGHPQAEHNTT
jgi:hypothetical protein